MQCAYCISEIPDEASVCKFCRRDLHVVKSLLAKIANLEARSNPGPDVPAHTSDVLDNLPTTKNVDEALPRRSILRDSIQYLLTPLSLLLLAHLLATVVFDTHVVALRVIAITLPLPFGLALFRHQRRSLLPWFACALILAFASVIGMSATTGLVDGTPVWPSSAIDWRELIEFATSIAFSFLTGMLIGWSIRVRSQSFDQKNSRNSVLERLARFGLPTRLSPSDLRKRMQAVVDFGGTLVALCTTCVSIYTGLKGVIGG